MVFRHTTLRALAARVDELIVGQARAALPALLRGTDDGPAPLSFSQQRMWVVQQLAPEGVAYNIPAAIRLRGSLDVLAMTRAVDAVVERHEMLRSVYRLDGDELTQVVTPFTPEPLLVVDVSGAGDQAAQSALDLAGEFVRLPFDLANGPVLRRVLYRVAADDHLLVLCLHHIAGDAWSLGIVGRELSTLYNGYIGGTEPQLPPLPIRYRDYARWQRDSLQGGALDGELAYWRRKLAGIEPIDLPTDRPRPAVLSDRGAQHVAHLSTELEARILQLARGENSTRFSMLAAAFAVVMHRWSGQDDFVFAVPVANRTAVEVESLVGTCVNTLPLRIDCSGAPTFRELLRRVQGGALEAFAHQDLPFERLVEDADIPRAASRAPIAQVMFNLQNVPVRGIGFTDIAIDILTPHRHASQFELGVSLELVMSRLMVIEYSADLYDAATIDRLAQQFLRLLDAACDAPDTSIDALALLPDDEYQLVVHGWNATDAEYPRDTTAAQLIAAQAASTPHAIAVVGEDATLSYAQLDARANRFARHLRACGARRGGVVGICLSRTTDLLAALLAVQKSGAAYLPLDPYFPPERIAYMLADSGARLLVTDPDSADGLDAPEGVRVIDLSRDAAAIGARDDAPLDDAPLPDDAAYLIYTSGSTGQPKGVVVPHGALVNFLVSMRRTPGISASDVLGAVTTVSFDIAGLELYLPLLVGARIELLTRDVAVDGELLAQRLVDRGVTMLQATPATWRLLLESGWQGTPAFRALCGGEGLPPELAEQLLTRVGELWNLYGPTETTVWSTAARVVPGVPITIGTPIANTRVYILDAALQPAPIGVPGELWIGGDGVATGYHNRPELTAERFLPDRFIGGNARMYRTGDRARWKLDGTLEHLGRLDNQVKVRGYRIELGEIETVLAAHPSIRHCVVMPQDAGQGDVRLVAYVVYVAGQDLSVSEVRRLLRKQLPDYMIPSMFVTLDALPLTPNGKVDRKALPDPFVGARHSAPADRTPPAPGLETILADIWQSVLQLDAVGADDNFFELGGHSLLALRVASAVHARTGWRMDPRLLFFQQLRQIAAAAPVTTMQPESITA